MERRRSLGRWAKAQARYLRIALSLFWRSLVAITLLWLLGALAFYLFLEHEGGGPTLTQSLWASFALMSSEPAFPFPERLPLQLIYFMLPIAGLLLVAESVVRFSLLILNKREKEWMEAMAATSRNHVILCGLGSIGYRILEALHELKQEVVAIEKDPQGSYLSRAKDLGATVLIDDATVEAVLLKAGLEHAVAVIAATNSDICNLEIALDARRMKPGVRVVMRIFDQNTATKIREAFGIETMSSSALAAPTFALSALGADIISSVRIGEALLVTSEVEVQAGSPWDGATIAELTRRHRVVAITLRAGTRPPEISPAPETKLRVGDLLALQGALEEISAAREDARPRRQIKSA